MHSQKHKQVKNNPFMQTTLRVARTGWLSEPHPMEAQCRLSEATELAQEGPKDPGQLSESRVRDDERRPGGGGRAENTGQLSESQVRDDERSGRREGEHTETTNDQVRQRKRLARRLEGKQSSGDFFHDRRGQLRVQER